MSSLLTLSASHLARTTCDVNIPQLVLRHRGIALRGLREAIRGSAPDKYEAILAASMLLSWQDSEWYMNLHFIIQRILITSGPAGPPYGGE